MKLRISEDLALPKDAVTQTFGVLGMRGSGKSNAAVVMAEEMFKAGIHWVAIDPKGDWFGIRSSADGKSGGLPVVVFGGRHGDVPIEPASGPLLADLIIDQTMTCVLDLSEFTEGEKIRFLGGAGGADGFAARFYRRKDPAQPPTHMFLEEADDYLPQKAMRDKAKLLHDCSRLYLWGRQRGVGGTLITQRSARIHKDVLTQSGTLIVFRTTAPQDQKAILDWVKYHGQSEEVMKSLSGLKGGEGWVWSPEWLGTMKRVQFRRRETFDSGATPSGVSKARSPAMLADVDLGAIKDKMAATIEKAKAEDPRELRKQIAELKKQLAARPTETVTVPTIEYVEVPVLKNGVLDKTHRLMDRLEKVAAIAAEGAKALATSIHGVKSAAPPRPAPSVQRPQPTPAMPAPAPVRRPAAERREANEPTDGLTGPEQRIMDALAWLESIGVNTPEQTAVAFLAGYTVGGGAWNNPKGRLRGKGLIDYLSGDCLMLTDAGREVAERPGTPLTTAELHRAIMDRLPGPEQRLLRPLLDAYPNDLSNEELAAAAGYAPNAGAFNNPRGRLRSLGLIEYRSGRVAARSILFLE